MIEAPAAKPDAWAEDAGIACVVVAAPATAPWPFAPAVTCASWRMPAACRNPAMRARNLARRFFAGMTA